MPLSASARSSPLSRKQVVEVEKEIQKHHPEVCLEPTFVTTVGDRDQKTSLRTLDKTDFFTKDIDVQIQNGICRIGVHSAKDLPDPIPEGLSIAAITHGVDSSDVLVIPQGKTLKTLKSGAIIATSSERREENVRQLRSDFKFVDIRGTINQRLEKMDKGEVDGVVIAEAALIRLELTHLNRIKLPGETTPGQGQLAIVSREDDNEVHELLSCIDSRKKCLYLGLKAPKNDLYRRYYHTPLIKIVPRKLDRIPDISSFTHVIFTSQSTVEIFFRMIPNLKNKKVISVGTKTTQKLKSLGVDVSVTAVDETSEGIVSELEKLDLKNTKIFWPHSALSRPIISDYLTQKNIPFEEWVLYDTQFNEPKVLPKLDEIDEIFFTSPSTVDAFIHFYKTLPTDKILTPIGSITQNYLENQISIFCNTP
jgi:hydroxymethylbilane synthase